MRPPIRRSNFIARDSTCVGSPPREDARYMSGARRVSSGARRSNRWKLQLPRSGSSFPAREILNRNNNLVMKVSLRTKQSTEVATSAWFREWFVKGRARSVDDDAVPRARRAMLERG